MKELKEIIQEKLKIDSNSSISSGYIPKDRGELNLILLKKKIELDEYDYKLDCSDIDVSEIEDLSELFKEEDYKEINISGWNLNKCKTLKSMFYGCKYLEKIIGIDDLDISNVDELSFIFSGCRNLKNVGDLGKWDVKDKELNYAFQDCVKLKYIGNVKNWKLKNPHWSVFSNCDIPLKDLPSKKP